MPMVKTKEDDDPHNVARAIATQFAAIDRVEAVMLGGSLATGRADADSDIDLYIYSEGEIPVEARAAIINPRAREMQLDNAFWEAEDYWREEESGVKVETIYRNPDWETAYLKDLFANNRAHMGFSTSRWHSIVTFKILFDRSGWAASLKSSADMPYPDGLAKAIIEKNFALLRGSMADHPTGIASAVKRDDLVFVHSRINALLDCYFDILFALNRELHPGAKRQLAYAERLRLKPEKMKEDLTKLLTHCDPKQVVGKVEKIVDRLEDLLAKQGAL